LTIDALDKQEAEELRDYILSAKSSIIGSQTPEDTQAETELADESILHLQIADLFKVGISQNHLRSMAILFGFCPSPS
jgi:putative membrane protein